MIRLGSLSADTREMNLDDIFFSRLQLMIVMAKAYLNGCPLGECRRKAMYNNACHVEYEALELGRVLEKRPERGREQGPTAYDFIFYQRVKLLAVMMKAAAKGFPMGEHRRSAMQENLDVVCQALMFSGQPEAIAFLKVA